MAHGNPSAVGDVMDNIHRGVYEAEIVGPR